MDNHYTIDTPENIEFRYDIAGIGSRFLAALVDTILLGLLQISVLFLMFFLISRTNVGNDDGLTSIILAVGFLLLFFFQWGYFLLFEMIWNGQSPGKRMVRLRVVREGGRPITFGASAVRNLIRIVDFLPAFYGLGVVVMFIDRRVRRLGDLAGGTLVVKERHALSLESLTSRAVPLPPPALQLPNATTRGLSPMSICSPMQIMIWFRNFCADGQS
ncbi:MAG: RDD family protein [Chloroflexaceae bacterium]|nr:RDD family protein [Chloroflexaceae bacterium]